MSKDTNGLMQPQGLQINQISGGAGGFRFSQSLDQKLHRATLTPTPSTRGNMTESFVNSLGGRAEDLEDADEPNPEKEAVELAKKVKFLEHF